MHMKRLGETAVSPDGKWLAYSVTTVDLDQNTKTAELWLQPIAGGEPRLDPIGSPGDSGPQFAPDGKSILFISQPHRRASRSGSQTSTPPPAPPPTSASSPTSPPKPTTPMVARRPLDRLHLAPSILTARPSCPTTTAPATECNCDRDAAARRQQGQGADLHPPALPPLEPLHRRQALPPLPRLG